MKKDEEIVAQELLSIRLSPAEKTHIRKELIFFMKNYAPILYTTSHPLDGPEDAVGKEEQRL